MKISKLIEMLKERLAEDGDLEVNLMGDEMDEVGELAGVSTLVGDDGPIEFSLCGPETLNAFVES